MTLSIYRGSWVPAEIVRALRDRLVPRGWSYSNPRNYALTTEPSGAFTIAVAGGNANTGCEANPITRAEKGTATRAAIDRNLQLTFVHVDPEFPRIETPDTILTWILLHFVDESLGEIRMELSQPAGMDGDGYVTRWSERIILRPETFGMPPERDRRPHDDAGDDAIDIPVERRRQRSRNVGLQSATTWPSSQAPRGHQASACWRSGRFNPDRHRLRARREGTERGDTG